MDIKKIYKKVTNHIKKNWHVYIAIISILILLIAFYLGIKNHKSPVITESQYQVQTTEGIQNAAKNADVKISSGQAKEISQEIKYIYETNQTPEYIVPTVGKEVVKKSKEITKKEGADFAIVTNPKNPEEKVNLKNIPDNAPVELNQYNIHTAPKVLREISAGKNVDNGNVIIGAGIKKRITKEGQYIGVQVLHEFGDNRTYVMATYSW